MRGALCFAVLALCSCATARSAAGRDKGPLDRISGTEGWRDVVGVDTEAEWKTWYDGRKKWRSSRRAMRLERARNRYLARILARAGAGVLDRRAVRRVVRARLRRRGAPSWQRPKRATRALDQDEDDLLLGRKRRRSETPEPPAWTKVPVERLDKDGQAVDSEGDRVLRKTRRGKH